MGTGLSPLQKQALGIIRERTEQRRVTTVSDISEILYPEGYRLIHRRTWGISHTKKTSLLRALHRLENRGLVKCLGFGSKGELRWWDVQNPNVQKLPR